MLSLHQQREAAEEREGKKKETATPLALSHFAAFQPSGWAAVGLRSHRGQPRRHVPVQWAD